MENTHSDQQTPKTADQMTHDEYWRSLDEKYKTPEFIKTLDNEFMSSPLREEDGKDGMARRQFMKLMGASVALSAAACVRRPVEKIIPYNKRPAEIIPDVSNYYASAWFDGSEGFSTIVKTREGRPLHIAKNVAHPVAGNGISARASAHILALYDPDRIKAPTINSVNPKKRRNSVTVNTTWDKVDERVSAQLKKGQVALLTSSLPSVSSQDLMNDFLVKFNGKKYVWDVMTTESVRTAQRISYGAAVVPQYHFEKAKAIVSLDADFLGTYITPVAFTGQFLKGRDPGANMSRLVSFQSVVSLTSLNSDDNYPVRASQQLGVALALLKFVLAKKSGGFPERLNPFVADDAQLGVETGTLQKVAQKLIDNAGESLVIAGGLATENENSIHLQLAVNWINSALGNEGRTVSAQGVRRGLEGSSEDVMDLIAAINNGQVKTLILNNVNPLYALPTSLGFEEALNKVEMVISTSNWMDESARLADVVAPAGHAMENWNEYEFVAGVRTIQQPTIRPLFDTRSFEDSLMVWSKAAGKPVANENSFYELIKSKAIRATGSEKGWFDYLQAGFVGASSGASAARSLSSAAAAEIQPKSYEVNGPELVLFPTSHMADGSMANVSWLQELPDPVSKMVWDNALTVSPADAKEWKLKDGSMVEITVGETKMKVPVFIQPGQARGVVGMAIGYGREAGGELQKGVGINVFPLVQVSKNRLVYSAIPVQVKKVSGKYEFAVTQGHHTMEGRQIVVETDLKSFQKGETGIHRHKIFSIWGQHKYDGHKWAMSIDLNSCTGCSACVIACQSENNIPVVGKKYVMQGREMHWIRIDRYYKGSEHNPDAVFQPLLCQHCENAPCETVCPVVATVHSDEGLNDMVYNRCVGTRYCSNNCPYKVRRFNWFYYDGHHRKEPLHMALNPDVSVRTRGVMEKCSFCVQRIKEAKNVAKDENRALRDGEIVPACAEVCPGDGIVFGDLNDKDSAVSKMFASQRQYTLLEEVNAAPRVRYLSKVRNTDREMGGHHHAPAHEGQEAHSQKEQHT